MSGFFNFSSDRLAWPLLAGMAVALTLLVILGLRAPHLARIGLRNARRRKARTSLIVAGLMLSTMFIASALAVDDTITLAVKTIAVFNLGRVDEDVIGGNGPLALYPQDIGATVRDALATSPHVAGVAPALVVPNLLVADETARQVRGGVSGLGLAPQSGGPLTNLLDATQGPASVDALAAGQVYLNASVAKLLNARTGDTIALYSTLWPGHRYRFTVRAIVTGGPLGDSPSLVLPLATLQQLAGASAQINHVYVANAGNGLSGVGYSEEIEHRIYHVLFDPSQQIQQIVAPGGGGNFTVSGQGTVVITRNGTQTTYVGITNPAVAYDLRVDKVKQDGINFALQAQDIFGRILALFTLFALSIGLLLIFLIFVLLAAERRAEFGVLRALGVRRSRIVRLLLFEGAYYDGFAAALGMLAGLGLGILLVALVSPVIAKIGFPLKVAVTPQSVITAFGLGLLVTLVTIWLAAWAVSRMTVAAALRDLPEPPTPQRSFLALVREALALPAADPGSGPRPRTILAAWAALAWALVARGFAPLALGWWLIRRGRQSGDALFFSLGLSFLATGAALLLRWLYLATLSTLLRFSHAPDRALRLVRANRLIGRFTAVLIGVSLALYWSLPFDAVKRWGFARFSGNGVETFFIAGVMMVFGTVWALAPNLDLLLAPVSWLLGRLGRLRHITRVALIYPAHHRYRTGIGLSLFSLVCFTMVVMACIASSTTHSYDNIPAQASGYDVAGQPLFAPVGGVGPVTAALKNGSSGAASALPAVSAATPLPLGIIQPEAPNARWQVYPTSEVSGAFLDGVGLPLAARASGYTSDAAVWQAVRDHPGDVVIDAGALSGGDANTLGVIAPPDLSPQQFIGPPIASGLPGLSSLEALNGASGQAGSLQQRQNALGPLAAFAAASQDPYILDQVTLRLNGVATGPGQIAPTTLWAADLRGGKPEQLTVVGIVDNSRGQRYGLFGSPQTFAPIEKGLAPFGNEYYYFKLKPGADAHAAALQIGSTLLNYGFETTVIQDILLDVNGPRVFISRVLVGLVGLTLLVGMAALAVTGSRAVVERRQQIGMLRALGFHRLHVQAIFLIESLLVGAFGTAIGLALGLVLCRNVFAVNFFASLQSNLTLVVPWPELWVICGASLLASTIASLLPAWQAGRVSPADALRYE